MWQEERKQYLYKSLFELIMTLSLFSFLILIKDRNTIIRLKIKIIIEV